MTTIDRKMPDHGCDPALIPPIVELVRSRIMASVGRKDTKPEMLVRKAAHRLGLRFRLHVARLPGRPDLVFPSRKMAVFVNGCFWHRHEGCRRATTPKSNEAFWLAKFDANVARDARNYSALEQLGWRSAVLWECELRSLEMAEEAVMTTLLAVEP